MVHSVARPQSQRARQIEITAQYTWPAWIGATPGRMASAAAVPNTVATAADAGLDISRHLARQLDAELVAWADTILCMAPSHAHAVRGIDSTAEFLARQKQQMEEKK